ncbi:COG2199 c-di-GMP synthetase (diguanylate cyclase, GGDEF domain) [Comamonadaceae bacterium]
MSARPNPTNFKLHVPDGAFSNGHHAEPSALEGALLSNAQLREQVTQLRNALVRTQRDLAGTRAGERSARHLARHDGLTRLPNRAYFEACLQESLNEQLAHQRGLALFFLDLDDFKHINDTHGHAMGDNLLQIVAARLNQSVRKEDMVCRLGGDEFACLLRGSNQVRQLMQLAAKLFDSVAAPCQLQAYELTVRPSIGIAICPPCDITGSELLARADAAMYRAKREQTGYAFFEAPA